MHLLLFQKGSNYKDNNLHKLENIYVKCVKLKEYIILRMLNLQIQI